MKKGSAGILVLVLLLVAMIAACTATNEPVDTTTPEAPVEIEQPAEESEPATEEPVVPAPVILTPAEATEQSLAMAEELEAEGIVLLRNENDALPLEAGAKVNLFGYGSIDPIYGGTGSGTTDTSTSVNIVDGLKNAGLDVNDELVGFYETSGVSRPVQIGYGGSDFTPVEVPASQYPDELLTSARDFSDIAIVVISRIGGEGGDIPQDLYAEGFSATDDGRHYLELTQDEEDLLALVKGQDFERIIVLVNSCNAMELGFVEDVDAALWVGTPGGVGFNSVGRVLTGEVNPSGRLVDTYAYDLTSSAAYHNAGDFTYGNLTGRHYVEFAEGIYVGYRYYETAAADGFIDYDETVQYPFGYGLSYTTFDQAIESFDDADGTIDVQVKVTNTGDVAGKDVAQVYFTAPYTKGGIEKAHVVLAGFAKTKLLGPGESETLTITFSEEDMASFDASGEGCYVLEAGTYEIKLMANSHDLIDSREHVLDETVVYDESNPRESDEAAATVRFDDVENGQITDYVSRADWAGTVPTSRVDGKAASQAVVDAFTAKTPYEVDDSDPDITYADNGLTLADMAGLDKDDPKWDLLLEQLSDEDMASLICTGGWGTPAIGSIGKLAYKDTDGPAGINDYITGIMGVSFPSEVVIGSTWNTELVEEFGRVFAQEGLANGFTGLYAPGVNIHRTPFSGRNFEYFSEDGLLTGKLAVAEVKGAASQGVTMFVKHFALNDQDENRASISVWANEQSMRELYLRPFEIAVKEGHTMGIMSAYVHLGITWAGASHALLTDVLRSEWGYAGMVLSDACSYAVDYMDANLAIRAGNDMMLNLAEGGTIEPYGLIQVSTLETDNNTARNAMREACHNILYVLANSAAVPLTEPEP